MEMGSSVSPSSIAPQGSIGGGEALGLIVVHQGEVWAAYLDDGAVTERRMAYDPPAFARFLRDAPECLLVSTHVGARVVDVFKHEPNDLQVVASPQGNGTDWSSIFPVEVLDEIRPGWRDQQSRAEELGYIETALVHYFGWRKGHKAYRTRHYCLDPYLFARHNDSERYRRMTIEEMMEWALDHYEWLHRHDLKPAPTYFKLASQLLRRFFDYGHAERLNEKLRPSLPGNHYVYLANPRICYPEVIEIDQSNAHHNSAFGMRFPLKSALRLMEDVSLPPTTPYLEYPGLFRASADILHDDALQVPPFNDKGKTVSGWLYSSDAWHLLHDPRIYSLEVTHAYVSPEADIRPNVYAEWALAELARANKRMKTWLKPTLLAVYGLLGARPYHKRNLYLRSKGETSKRFHVGRDRYLDFREQASDGWARYTNILHRGLIEAETRTRTLAMARYLRATGDYAILAIYADGVFVSPLKKNVQLPILRQIVEGDWKLTTITNAHFPNTGQVVCDQYEKLPGMIGAVRKAYAERIRG